MRPKQVASPPRGLRDSIHAPGYTPGSHSSRVRQPRVRFSPTIPDSSPDHVEFGSINRLVHKRSGKPRSPPPLCTGDGEGSDQGCAGPSGCQSQSSGSPVTPGTSDTGSPIIHSPTSPSRYKPHSQRSSQCPARGKTPTGDQTGHSPTSTRSSQPYSYQIWNSNGPVAGKVSPKGKQKAVKLLDSVAERRSIEEASSAVLDPSNIHGQSSQTQTNDIPDIVVSEP